MFKKVLYVFSVILVGFLLITNTVLSNIVKEGQVIIKEHLQNEEYIEAISFFGTWFDEEVVYSFEDSDGQIVQVYNAIADKVHNEYKEGTQGTDDEEIEKSYGIKDNALNIFLYDLGSEFAISNKDKEVKDAGGIKLTFVDGNEYFISFVNQDSNSYEYYAYYGFLPISVFETNILADLNKDGNDYTEVPMISAISVVDYNGKVHIDTSIETLDQFNYESEIKNDFATIISEYNEMVSGKSDLSNEELSKKRAELEKQVLEILEEKEYGTPQDISIVFNRIGFILPTAVVMGVYLVVAVALGYFVFRKKKDSYTPVRRTTPVVKPMDIIEEPKDETK